MGRQACWCVLERHEVLTLPEYSPRARGGGLFSRIVCVYVTAVCELSPLLTASHLRASVPVTQWRNRVESLLNLGPAVQDSIQKDAFQGIKREDVSTYEYFSEYVLPGRHVRMLAIRASKWPVVERCVSHLCMCVWLSMSGCMSMFQRVPQNYRLLQGYSKVTLSPLYLISTLASSPGVCGEPAVLRAPTH